MCAVFFSEEDFSTGANRQKNQHWTHGQGNDIEPESLAFNYKDMIACITSAVIIFSDDLCDQTNT